MAALGQGDRPEDIRAGFDVVFPIEFTGVKHLLPRLVAHFEFDPDSHDVQRAGGKAGAGLVVGQNDSHLECTTCLRRVRSLYLQRDDWSLWPHFSKSFDLGLSHQPLVHFSGVHLGAGRAESIRHELICRGEPVIVIFRIKPRCQIVRIGRI